MAANADSFAESPQPRLSFGSVPPIERLSIPAAVTESIQGKSHTVYVIEVHSNGSTWQVFEPFPLAFFVFNLVAGQASLSRIRSFA